MSNICLALSIHFCVPLSSRFFFSQCVYLIPPPHAHPNWTTSFLEVRSCFLLLGNICSKFSGPVPLVNTLLCSPYKPLGCHRVSRSLAAWPRLPGSSGMQKWHRLLLQPDFGQYDPFQCLGKVSIAQKCHVCPLPPIQKWSWQHANLHPNYLAVIERYKLAFSGRCFFKGTCCRS